MLCPPPSTVGPRPRSAPTPPPTAGSPPEVVEVRTEPVDGVETPTQLLRAGRLWLVRSATRQPGADRLWRVQAGSGPTTAALVLHLQQSPDGRWSASERAGAASTELAGWP